MLHAAPPLSEAQFLRLGRAERVAYVEVCEEAQRRNARRLIDTYYPEKGPLRRELYPKHMEFFAKGALHNERAVIGANRVGKSTGTGGYETTLHLTGDYPDWWPGRRFKGPVSAWVAGEDAKLVRDTIQEILMGPHEAIGTGLIPGDAIERKTPRGGVPDAFDTVFVKHLTGGTSMMTFKSYDQGREAFQGAKKDLIWLDEEPPMAIYTEALTRTMATTPGEPNGILMATWTPLKGMSEAVLAYLPGGRMPATEEERLKAWGW